MAALGKSSGNSEQVQQLELEQDEAQVEPGVEWQQQQQQRGGDGGDEEQEEQEQQSAGVVARRGVEERGAALLCAPRWRNFLAGDILRVGVPGRGGFSIYLSIYRPTRNAERNLRAFAWGGTRAHARKPKASHTHRPPLSCTS